MYKKYLPVAYGRYTGNPALIRKDDAKLQKRIIDKYNETYLHMFCLVTFFLL